MAQRTTLSLTATPGRLYGSFAGKGFTGIKGKGPFTRLGWDATPRMRYTSFAGKGKITPIRPGPQPGGGDTRKKGWLRLREQIIQEDSEFIEILTALIENEIIH